MLKVYTDLWLSRPYFPFVNTFPNLKFHSFLLRREKGNILFYTGEISNDYDEITALGGISRHYLSHHHEAGPGLAAVKARFRNTLHSHRDAEPLTRMHAEIDKVFQTRERHPGDIDAIPCPGHTAGSACYLTNSTDGRTYLFIGDTIYPAGGKFEALVSRSDRMVFLNSIELLRTLEPDVVLFGATMSDDAFHEFTSKTWRAALDQAAESINS